jgi:2,3-bisphosphoglycerate-independent phosphoglycerate mutase
MINEDGSPNTQHSLNPVPVFLIGAGAEKNIRSGKLGDIAPTILHLMQLPIPKEMTGEVLVH